MSQEHVLPYFEIKLTDPYNTHLSITVHSNTIHLILLQTPMIAGIVIFLLRSRLKLKEKPN